MPASRLPRRPAAKQPAPRRVDERDVPIAMPGQLRCDELLHAVNEPGWRHEQRCDLIPHHDDVAHHPGDWQSHELTPTEPEIF